MPLKARTAGSEPAMPETKPESRRTGSWVVAEETSQAPSAKIAARQNAAGRTEALLQRAILYRHSGQLSTSQVHTARRADATPLPALQGSKLSGLGSDTCRFGTPGRVSDCRGAERQANFRCTWIAAKHRWMRGLGDPTPRRL